MRLSSPENSVERSIATERRGASGCLRSGKTLLHVLVGLIVVVTLGVVVWQVIIRADWTSEESRPTMFEVQQGEFLNEITERGSVESASNVEVRCEVKSRGKGGATILWVIPEGTNVQKGDKLIEFDASALESNLTQQQISYSNSEAGLTKAKNDLKNANDALEEYNSGTYPLEEMAIQIKKFTAEENKRQAQQTLDYTKELARKGYVPDLRVEKDEFSLKKAELDYKSAETELMVLEKFKRPKQLNQLNSNIRTAEANLTSAEAKKDLEKDELKLIEEQIKKCVVYADEPGEVVYANMTNRHGGQEIIIEAGATVREQQVVIRLPDPKRMQVKANINESKVTAVQEGQPVKITLGAMKDVALDGVVDKVDEYPAPAAWWAGSTKQYRTYIRILDTDVLLKTGLTAKIDIEIERIPDCIQVPVQSIFEHGEKYYCVMEDSKSEKGRVAKEITIGSTN
ncbi:MAG: HlyD family efflux transporter periplasmic adaptor subunit, partial [Planctomycetia bacterium]